MDELWYKDVAYEDAKELVKENLVNTVAAFIASGYWLKYIRDSRDYEKDGYQSLWDCAEKEFGLKISEASRAMSMNDKYSIDGNTPFMLENYKRYNKSQLQEMLTMSDEQIEQVTPDMTIKDIREIKSPKTEDSEEKQKKLKDFIHNFVQFEYLELYHSFPEAAGISIKQLQEVFEGKLSSHKLIWFIMLGDEESELVDAYSGEILEKYSSNTVIDMISSYFIQTREQKTRPLPPGVKGLMDNPYCSVCGSPLNSPDTDNMSMECAECGQAVDWSEYIKSFCDVATDTVDTECGDELSENIYTEIEDEPDAEEPLSVEFDTDELMQELEDVIDGEYQEVPEERSAYGLEKTEYSESSLLTTKGCGNKYYCSSCAQDCAIRQEEMYCRYAPMGSPYDCTTMNVLENLKDEMSSRCQFINLDIAEHCAGNGAPDPCCNNCNESCGYRCRKSVLDKMEPAEQETGKEGITDAQYRLSAVRNLFEKKNDELKQYLEFEDIPEYAIFEKRTIAEALGRMVCELETAEEKEDTAEPEQPEFPRFKNNIQRQKWLEDVEAWGLWYADENIQARYYKYDFPDGSRLIAVKYRYTAAPWLKDESPYKEYDGSYKYTYYHMIYSAEYKKEHEYEYENYYTNETASISSLVAFLKEIQKGHKSE